MKKILVIIGVILIVATLVFIVIFRFNNNNEEQIDNNTPEQVENDHQESADDLNDDLDSSSESIGGDVDSPDEGCSVEKKSSLRAEYKISEFEDRADELDAATRVAQELPQEYYDELAELEREYDIRGKGIEAFNLEIWARIVALLNKYGADPTFIEDMDELLAEYKIVEYAEKYAEFCGDSSESTQ